MHRSCQGGHNRPGKIMCRTKKLGMSVKPGGREIRKEVVGGNSERARSLGTGSKSDACEKREWEEPRAKALNRVEEAARAMRAAAEQLRVIEAVWHQD